MKSFKSYAAALALGTAAATAVASAPAQAAVPFESSSDFGQDQIAKGPFEYTYNFGVPFAGTSDVGISYFLKATGITSLTATFNNQALTFTKVAGTKNSYYGFLEGVSVQSGLQTLVVRGVSNASGNGSAASFAGTFNFSAVPEPASWALMVLGFGAAGAMLRRRNARTSYTVRFA